jgi:hypothetical protein
MKQSSRLEVAHSCGVMIGAQLILTGFATYFVALSERPFVMASLTVLSIMAIAAWLGIPRKPKVTAIVLSTVISVVCVYGWRRLVDPMGFMGPVPTSLEIPALGASAALIILFGAIVAMASNRDGRLYRVRWAFVILFSIVVVGGLFVLSASRLHTSSTMRMQLQQVSQSEAHLDSSAPFERQQLSFWLGVFGRGSEAQAFSTLSARPYSHGEQPTVVSAEWEQGISSRAVDWRRAISEIAARERIVIIMEAHNATQHREWIEQTLPIFHKAGFRHYAAEALQEAGGALKKRGYPVQTTGFYVADPRFGNLLRRAIELEYAVHEYEALLASEIPQREEQQAQALANIIAANPGCKMVIHAGYAHSFKQPVPVVGKWMAARLWEKTGIEPYCIYQGHEEYDSPNYPRLVELAGATDEPKMLIPPPPRLSDPQFAGIPAHAVDALVINPVAKGKSPTARKPVFPSDMTQISGRWLEREWPIVVGAYHTGEPVDAIALDQVMLRQGESEFELWIPSQACELRVTSPSGVVDIDIEPDQTGFRLRRAAASQERQATNVNSKN